MPCSENIKKIRISLCLEQEEFAKKLGVTKSTVSNWERGARKPRLSVIRKIRELAKENKMEFSVEDFLS